MIAKFENNNRIS